MTRDITLMPCKQHDRTGSGHGKRAGRMVYALGSSLSSVAFHGGSSHFFGISIYPVSDTAGISIFRSVLLYVSFGGNTFGDSFFEKLFRGNSFFSQKEAKCSKRGPRPPLLRKKGAPANFLRGLIRYADTLRDVENITDSDAELNDENKSGM
jgi:hypothetical protein